MWVSKSVEMLHLKHKSWGPVCCPRCWECLVLVMSQTSRWSFNWYSQVWRNNLLVCRQKGLCPFTLSLQIYKSFFHEHSKNREKLVKSSYLGLSAIKIWSYDGLQPARAKELEGGICGHIHPLCFSVGCWAWLLNSSFQLWFVIRLLRTGNPNSVVLKHFAILSLSVSQPTRGEADNPHCWALFSSPDMEICSSGGGALWRHPPCFQGEEG